jgi:hypothetical protein
MQPYTELEKNYLIEQRTKDTIKKYGSVENALNFHKKELEEMEGLWSKYSGDDLGHGITCTRLIVRRLVEMK